MCLCIYTYGLCNPVWIYRRKINNMMKTLLEMTVLLTRKILLLLLTTGVEVDLAPRARVALTLMQAFWSNFRFSYKI